MSDEFKSIARKVAPASEPFDNPQDKPMSRRAARGRLKNERRDVISDGIEAYEDAQQEGGDFAPYVEDIEL
jgi:hypothetical protein